MATMPAIAPGVEATTKAVEELATERKCPKFPHWERVLHPTQGCEKCDGSTLGVGTGTLDELAGYHTRLAIYPALTICYQRVVICALLDTRFKGRR